MSKKANHICKNINCPNGIDGKPKEYYACDYCDRANQWRSMACCMDCYDAYMQQVVESRSKNETVNILPERIDMTENKLKELMNKPIENVLETTKEELKEYTDDGYTIAEAINLINAEIDGADNNSSKEINTVKTNSTIHSKKKKN